jgi:hypothetical protein
VTAVPSVPSFATGQVTVTKLTQLGDALAYSLATPIATLIQINSQSIPNNTFTALTLDSEGVDSAGGHDNSTNPSRYTAVYAGWYELSGGCTFVANATGRRLARWIVNGTSVPGSLAGIPGNASILGFSPRTVYALLDVGDYAELQVYQDSGGALSTFVANTEYRPSAFIRWVGNA